MNPSGMARGKAVASKACAKNVDGLVQNLRERLDSTTAEVRVRNLLETMPESMRLRYCKAMSGKSLRAGVNAHCLECVGWVRDDVRNCTSPACPLFPYRPFR